MVEAFVAAATVFVFLIAVYFLLDYRKSKREWRKEVRAVLP